MKRLLVAGLSLLAGAMFFMSSRREPTADRVTATPKADSVWYHASDVALVGASGRPQLVEFFHPN